MITENLIAGELSAQGTEQLQVVSPLTQKTLPQQYAIATEEEIKLAAQKASEAHTIYRNTSGSQKAAFLRTIAQEIENLGDTLIEIAMEESGLPKGRLEGERGRTCNQIRSFADWIEEGSWVDAVIDEAIPDRKPFQKADIRKMSISLGPVAVFTASNFPLAFSTAGGDTAAALAAGCPVIVKAHPSHLGTNALVSKAIAQAIKTHQLPSGVFSTIQGGIPTGKALATHPFIKAIAFTGSFTGGKALTDLANQRPEPIPVYAEMGSNNPIFILEEKITSEAASLATMIAGSVNLGAGQFCTNPGILVIPKAQGNDFIEHLKKEFLQLQPATMLNEGIYKVYHNQVTTFLEDDAIQTGATQESNQDWTGTPTFGTIEAKDFLANKNLQQEVFGPFTLVVLCDDQQEMMQVADGLHGQLTATVIGTEEEIIAAAHLVTQLTQKAGRVLFNGVPTGVEVCPAMHHGGPYPSTSNSIFTSVGVDAIKRFVRPVSFQNAPEALLPDALKPNNPLGIWRTVNGKKKNKL